MKERPILFSAPMVRALRAGTKTQTRRVFKVPRGCSWYEALGGEAEGQLQDDTGPAWWHVSEQGCPYGRPGDRLWVREGYSGPHWMAGVPPRDWIPGTPIWYWADGNPSHGDWTKPKPGMHMPRWASRILLEVTEVRVERLQDISEADALAEGVSVHPDHHEKPRASLYGPVQAYRDLWDSLNGDKPVACWDASPWVWAVSFKRIEGGQPGGSGE